MASSPLWMIVCLGLLIKTSKAQSCIQGRSGGGLPFFQTYTGGVLNRNRIKRHHQAIIPSYKFDCGNQMCGNITEWGVDVSSGTLSHDMKYTLDLQVWRPSPTVDDSTSTGCYSLVGNNSFTSIPLRNGVATPSVAPQDYIQFQPGDVLGIYVEKASESDDGVVILTSYSDTTSFTSELVWYASITPTMVSSQNGDCPYSVGSSGVLNKLTQAAPVISVSTVTFPCPRLPSMATTQPTPPPNPTTDSEETSTTTTQEPVDISEGTGTELRVLTTSETATDLPILRPSESTDIGLIIGIVVIVIVVITSVVAVVVICAVLLKKHRGKMTTIALPTTANQTYGLNTHQSKRVEESVYDYPEVYLDNTIEAKQNEAYVTSTDITTERNQAYGTNDDMIITEGNQAYAINIITEKNAAYKPVTTVETVNEYDYI